MVCKDICAKYKARKPSNNGRYASGQKRCQICEIFIKWDGLWCPCCGYRLRTKPRNARYKLRLKERMIEKDKEEEREEEQLQQQQKKQRQQQEQEGARKKDKNEAEVDDDDEKVKELVKVLEALRLAGVRV